MGKFSWRSKDGDWGSTRNWPLLARHVKLGGCKVVIMAVLVAITATGAAFRHGPGQIPETAHRPGSPVLRLKIIGTYSDTQEDVAEQKKIQE